MPFLLGVWWTRGTPAAALAAMAAGFVVRAVLFVLTPTFYGADNTLLYLDDDVVGPGFDGWPTFIAPVVSLVVYLAGGAATRRSATGASIGASAPVRGREPEPV